MSRIEAGAGWRRWTWLWMAGMAFTGMACRSAGTPGPSESTRGPVECPAKFLAPQQSLTYTLSCDGFTPPAQRLEKGAKVTFVSKCEQPVTLSFSQADTLFISGRSTIVLKAGEQTEETISQTGGCHEACFGSSQCPPTDDRDAKTGSLDVYTSGGGTEPTAAPGR